MTTRLRLPQGCASLPRRGFPYASCSQPFRRSLHQATTPYDAQRREPRAVSVRARQCARCPPISRPAKPAEPMSSCPHPEAPRAPRCRHPREPCGGQAIRLRRADPAKWARSFPDPDNRSAGRDRVGLVMRDQNDRQARILGLREHEFPHLLTQALIELRKGFVEQQCARR